MTSERCWIFLVVALVAAGLPVHADILSSIDKLEKTLGSFCTRKLDLNVPKFLGGEEFGNATLHPDFNADTIELAVRYGYEAERQEVETEDGYILSVFRIRGDKSRLEKNGKPILLVHGYLQNSDHWMLLGRNSFAFMLADEGYDVWLLDTRGSTHSLRHRTLSADEPDFWQFTWHEMGVLDLPATIDHVLSRTGRERLVYVGFSTGTTNFFVMTSERPEYNERVETMVAFAPIVYWNSIGMVPRSIIADLSPFAFDYASRYQRVALLSFGGYLLDCMKRLCRTPLLSDQFCVPILNGLFGYNTKQEEKSMLPIFANHLSSGSLKQVVHFGQIASYKKFQQFDYRSDVVNLKKYDATEPPRYNLGNVKVPVKLYTGNKDPLGNEMNIKDLMKELSTEVSHEQVKSENFDHVSFTWGKDAPKILYPQVIDYLKNFDNKVDDS